MSAKQAKQAKQVYYAVKSGIIPGIYLTWTEAEYQVKGFKGAKYQKFETRDEAEAWIAGTNSSPVAGPSQDVEMPESTELSVIRLESTNISMFIEQAVPVRTWKLAHIFTDGSFRKSSGKAGAGIYFDPASPGIHIDLPAGSTNNQAELLAISMALDIVYVCLVTKKHGLDSPIVIVSDSMYCIDTITNWIPKWVKNGWVTSQGTPVKNKELIQHIWQTYNQILAKTNREFLAIKHQPSHTKSASSVSPDSQEYLYWHGNKMADYLATLD